MSRLFGTDGVRGVANKELTPDLAFKLGWAGPKSWLARPCTNLSSWLASTHAFPAICWNLPWWLVSAQQEPMPWFVA
jgi:hypothetical protein